jgi:hypothetical protein
VFFGIFFASEYVFFAKEVKIEESKVILLFYLELLNMGISCKLEISI